MKFCCIDNDLKLRYANCIDELDILNQYGEFTNGKIDASDDEKVALACDCEVVFFGSTALSNDIISRLPKLKILQFMGSGVTNYVDVGYCERKGIKVLNVDEYGSNAVAEYTLAMILAALRNIPKSDMRMKSGKWAFNDLEGLEVEGSTVGVVGTGKIGSRVAEKLKLLGAKKIYAFDMYENKMLIENNVVEYKSLDEIFKECDIVTLHLKYTENTYQIISADLINSMKQDAFLINIARAELVDYEALDKSLKARKIRGAAIDVYYTEPVEDYALCMNDNIITTHHIGFFTKNSKRNLLHNAISSVISSL